MPAIPNEIHVKIVPENGKTIINYRIQILYNKKESGMSCFLPGFNIYYFAKDEGMMLKKGRVLSKFYFDHFMEHTEKQGLKKLVLDLNRKGFKAKDNISTVHNLINNRMVKADFKAPQYILPRDFETASSVNQDAQFALA